MRRGAVRIGQRNTARHDNSVTHHFTVETFNGEIAAEGRSHFEDAGKKTHWSLWVSVTGAEGSFERVATGQYL